MSVTMRFGHGHGQYDGKPSANGSQMPLETRIRAAVRRCIAEEIERLVDVLDGLDVDPDFEPCLASWEPGSDDDREEEPEHAEDGGDREPTMGWTASGFSGQTFDEDERERDEDREPALGWTEEHDQTKRERMAEPWRWADEEA